MYTPSEEEKAQLRASFKAFGGENKFSFSPVRHSNGNGFFVPPLGKKYQLDPSLKRHLILDPISPLDRNARVRLSNKTLMTYRALIDLLQDHNQVFLESLHTERRITMVETQYIHVVSKNGLIVQTYGAIRGPEKWHCANFDYTSEGEMLKRKPFILSFVPPGSVPKRVVKK